MTAPLDLRAVERDLWTFAPASYMVRDLLALLRETRAALAKTATYNRVMPQDIDEARAVLTQATDNQEAAV